MSKKDFVQRVQLDMGLIYEYTRTMKTLLDDRDYKNLSPCIDRVNEISFAYCDKEVCSMLECLSTRTLDVINEEDNNMTKEDFIQKVKVENLDDHVENPSYVGTIESRAFARGWNACQKEILNNIDKTFREDLLEKD